MISRRVVGPPQATVDLGGARPSRIDSSARLQLLGGGSHCRRVRTLTQLETRWSWSPTEDERRAQPNQGPGPGAPGQPSGTEVDCPHCGWKAGCQKAKCADADRSRWVLFGVGGIVFALGKGLHTVANSVSNVEDFGVANASVVHLWDETVSHYVWFTGLFLVLVALALALRGHEFRVGVSGIAVSLLFAITLVNTYIEGGTPWLGIGFFLTGLGAAFRWRPTAVAQLLFFTAGVGLALLLGWGMYWFAEDGTVFPQFSELGWI